MKFQQLGFNRIAVNNIRLKLELLEKVSFRPVKTMHDLAELLMISRHCEHPEMKLALHHLLSNLNAEQYLQLLNTPLSQHLHSLLSEPPAFADSRQRGKNKIKHQRGDVSENSSQDSSLNTGTDRRRVYRGVISDD